MSAKVGRISDNTDNVIWVAPEVAPEQTENLLEGREDLRESPEDFPEGPEEGEVVQSLDDYRERVRGGHRGARLLVQPEERGARQEERLRGSRLVSGHAEARRIDPQYTRNEIIFLGLEKSGENF